MATAKSALMYRPLDPSTTLRLLTILPDKLDDALMRCMLEHHELEDGVYPRYQAMSYTWGDATQTGTIEVAYDPSVDRGQGSPSHDEFRGSASIKASTDAAAKHTFSRLTVTANCHNVLQAMREEDTPVRIWIDAICINQRDFSERG